MTPRSRASAVTLSWQMAILAESSLAIIFELQIIAPAREEAHDSVVRKLWALASNGAAPRACTSASVDTLEREGPIMAWFESWGSGDLPQIRSRTRSRAPTTRSRADLDLIDAIWANELPRLRALVAGGGNVNTADSAGATPVFIGEKKGL